MSVPYSKQLPEKPYLRTISQTVSQHWNPRYPSQRASHPRPPDFHTDLWGNSRGSSLRKFPHKMKGNFLGGCFRLLPLWNPWGYLHVEISLVFPSKISKCNLMTNESSRLCGKISQWERLPLISILGWLYGMYYLLTTMAHWCLHIYLDTICDIIPAIHVVPKITPECPTKWLWAITENQRIFISQIAAVIVSSPAA